ncbi:DNA-binding transcriptional regulator, LysR family [Pseudomonas linyingensis]|uniref:DNA-binding transcriptional regulator, LysR family n=1 Tax=Pseudomonas linyingensis TaxID=915471 RepID=A0A1H7AKA5_9PSED|nr:LysR substrate-binding domain-containing protein [Pseudomonas linyingensis]SEJ62320.1 DNA-binding transcriptional regulator, LysR family [Pseudomonas linyingensis]
MSRYARHLPPLETLIAFEAVGRNGSFTRAATELYLTQSAVSKQIRALEDSLGVALFERQARGIRLTAAGAAFYAEVGVALERLQGAATRIRAAHQSNSVSVLCTHAVAQFWLFPHLLSFNRAHPAITVNLHASNEIDESRVADHDFGILYGAGRWSSLSAELLFPEIVYPLASARLQTAPVGTPAEVAALPLIELDASAWNCIDWRDWFRHFGLEHIPAEDAPTFNQVTLAFKAIEQGLGVGLGWEFMARDGIARGELKRVGAFAFVTGNADYLVHPRHKPLSAAAATFRDWLLGQTPA